MGEDIRDTSVTIGTTPVQLTLQQRPGARTVLSITNTSILGQAVSLAWGKAAVAGSGAVVYPGGNWGESIGNQFIPSDMEVWGVANAAGATVAIHERVKAVR